PLGEGRGEGPPTDQPRRSSVLPPRPPHEPLGNTPSRCQTTGSTPPRTRRRPPEPAPMRRALSAATLTTFALALGTGVALAAPPGLKTLEIGAAAPDFRLPGVDGKTHSLKDFADAKVLVVLFTCNHCPTAQAYEARVAKMHAEYRDKGVSLVAISPN